jgi:hypothetical protein
MRLMTSAQEPGHLQAGHLRFCSPCFYQGLRKLPPWRHYAAKTECHPGQNSSVVKIYLAGRFTLARLEANDNEGGN